MFPKTDQQRQCLSDAVKEIFLFRSLDQVGALYEVLDRMKDGCDGFFLNVLILQEQMQEVLDAMFERKVHSFWNIILVVHCEWQIVREPVYLMTSCNAILFYKLVSGDRR